MRISRPPQKSKLHRGAVQQLERAHRQGSKVGFAEGYQEGYFRGQANYLMQTIHEAVPFRPLHVLYVSTGKGYPYIPLDENIIATLRGMVGRLSVVGVRDQVSTMAGQLRPDLVVVLDGMDLSVEQVDEIRAYGIPVALWITDDPYYTDMMMNMVTHYNYVFSLEANSVSFYRKLGANAYYLPFAAFTQHFHPTRTRSLIRQDLAFVGTAYWNRVKWMEAILPQLMTDNFIISGIWWDRLSEFKT